MTKPIKSLRTIAEQSENAKELSRTRINMVLYSCVGCQDLGLKIVQKLVNAGELFIKPIKIFRTIAELSENAIERSRTRIKMVLYFCVGCQSLGLKIV